MTARRTAQRAQDVSGVHGDPGRGYGAHRGAQGEYGRVLMQHTTWEMQGEA